MLEFSKRKWKILWLLAAVQWLQQQHLPTVVAELRQRYSSRNLCSLHCSSSGGFPFMIINSSPNLSCSCWNTNTVLLGHAEPQRLQTKPCQMAVEKQCISTSRRESLKRWTLHSSAHNSSLAPAAGLLLLPLAHLFHPLPCGFHHNTAWHPPI